MIWAVLFLIESLQRLMCSGAEAKLFQHACHIDRGPVFGDPALGVTATDMHLLPGGLLPARLHAHEIPLHRAGGHQAMHDLITIRQLFLDRIADIGEGTAQAGNEHLEALTGRRQSGRRGVLNVITGKQLINHWDIAFIDHFRDEPTRHFLVVCSSHFHSSPRSILATIRLVLRYYSNFCLATIAGIRPLYCDAIGILAGDRFCIISPRSAQNSKTMALKPQRSRKRLPITFVQIGLFSLVLLGVVLGALLFPLTEQQRLIFSDLSAPAVELLAAISLFIAAKRSAARSRRLAFAWGAIAISMLLYAIGDSIWAVLDLVLQQAPFPSIADAFYLSDYVFFLVGVMLMINKPASKAELLNNALDLATILAAAILGFWNFLIGPIIQANAASPLLDQAIVVAYPIGDLVLLGAVLLILYGETGPQGLLHADDNDHGAQMPQARQLRERNYLAVSFLVGGLLLWIVADAIYTYQALLETYVSGGWLDFLWVVANVLIGLAAASQWADMPVSRRAENYLPGHASREWLGWIKTYLPYLWLLGAFLLLVAAAVTPLPMNFTSIAAGVGIILTLVVLRQLIALAENRRLNLQLKSQASELESANSDLNNEIAERLRIQEQLAYDVLHDHMTGLANRLLFLDRLGQAIQRSKRHPEPSFAVLFLDLDLFKVVNDSLGHSYGDQLLVAVAQRLKETLRSSDTIARFGGDEFAILLEDIADEDCTRKLAERIQQEISRPFMLDEHEVYVTASIGVAADTIKYSRPEDMLRDADLAMYQAKALGKGRSELFRMELRDQAFSRMQMEDELRRALDNREFRLYYQPIASLESDRVVGLEALLRWDHPTRGLLLPADFLAVAEESNLILPIGAWVLNEACRQLKLWQDQYPYLGNVSVNVNISDKEFSQPNLTEIVAQALSSSGLKGTSLRLEITERVLVDNFTTANLMIQSVQAMGVQVQMDDFGTGYSALAYLHKFPINALKIDRTFISEMGNDPKGLGLVRAIVLMGIELGMETIAEGIETDQQLRMLKSLACEFGQGFLLSMPLDAAAAGDMLVKLKT